MDSRSIESYYFLIKNKIMKIDAILSSYQQQTLQNAIDFLDKAKKIIPNDDPINYWSNCAWSIVSFATCIESFLTGHILAKIGETEIPNTQMPGYKWGFAQKIKFIENKLKIQISDSTSDWKNIIAMIHVRNDIIHFNKLGITTHLKVNNAEKMQDACKYVIKRCKICFGVKYAPWVERFIK